MLMIIINFIVLLQRKFQEINLAVNAMEEK